MALSIAHSNSEYVLCDVGSDSSNEHVDAVGNIPSWKVSVAFKVHVVDIFSSPVKNCSKLFSLSPINIWYCPTFLYSTISHPHRYQSRKPFSYPKHIRRLLELKKGFAINTLLDCMMWLLETSSCLRNSMFSKGNAYHLSMPM